MVKESAKRTDIRAISMIDLINKYQIFQIDILKIDDLKKLFENNPDL